MNTTRHTSTRETVETAIDLTKASKAASWEKLAELARAGALRLPGRQPEPKRVGARPPEPPAASPGENNRSRRYYVLLLNFSWWLT